ncbi:MAG TPA: dUTP diphosphatase [Candidatus Aveggerthella stercoripullorum]|uniref:Deoxyuridine 5'-triphosphate nucleotidohydrolase n=1 Tax=Candidatus Aveggerthella stercoripullorum TaxID=2840688 RepID=A0A9D1D405_9ACTN|nr:dUTP diphosphatase [Candidatus Aveggerthella stercoripullorum]
MSRLSIPVKLLSEGASMPQAMRMGDAGLDLRSVEQVTLRPFERALIPTGIALAIPEGYAGFVLPRSGLAAKHGFTLVNAPGLIDSNYRGEIKVIGMNLDPNDDFVISAGDRIAQLVIMRVCDCGLCAVEELDATERGAAGFGSSGV